MIPLNEFIGWPSADDPEVETVMDAVHAVKSDPAFKKHGWNYFISACDNRDLLDWINSDDRTDDDKKEFASLLGLTGMLYPEAPGIEFLEPIKGPLSMYDDDFGSDDSILTLCWDKSVVPGKVKELKSDRWGMILVNSSDYQQGELSNDRGKLPRRGLRWVWGEFSGVFPGYWCADDDAKRHMVKWGGFIEFKKGNIV